jgi:effector-binding domain-containing protein
MEIKTHPPMRVLYSSHQTTILQMNELVGHVAKQLYAEATRLGLLVSGPQYWMYHGMDGNPDTVFTLEISLPVQGDIIDSKFPVKELPAFKSLSHWHQGVWDKMPETYGEILQYIEQHRIPMSDECREVYYNVDFANGENNRVEIQLGII